MEERGPRGGFSTPWRVIWSAVWVGALTALAAALILGLIGTALGATAVKNGTGWQSVTRGGVAAVVCGAFFAFAAGGWAAGKIAGFRHAEPAILHASVAWLVALPLLLISLAFGAGNAYGGWYGGLVTPLGAAAVAAAPDLARFNALTALTAILVGLIGSTVGGWIASGEPMTFGHHRTRRPLFAHAKGDDR